MTWYEEKTYLTRAWRFLRTNKNFPLKNPLFGGTVHEICMLCMFRCADTILLRKWLTMDVRKSNIVWSGNNGCHVSQENVIKFWVALHPLFPDSYSVWRIPEQVSCWWEYRNVRFSPAADTGYFGGEGCDIDLQLTQCFTGPYCVNQSLSHTYIYEETSLSLVQKTLEW